MTGIIEKLLKENPEQRLEYIAVARLHTKEEVREFYKEYRNWVPKFLPEEVAKGRSVDDLVSTNLGYVIGYLSDPKEREMWYDIIGNMHPIFGRC